MFCFTHVLSPLGPWCQPKSIFWNIRVAESCHRCFLRSFPYFPPSVYIPHLLQNPAWTSPLGNLGRAHTIIINWKCPWVWFPVPLSPLKTGSIRGGPSFTQRVRFRSPLPGENHGSLTFSSAWPPPAETRSSQSPWFPFDLLPVLRGVRVGMFPPQTHFNLTVSLWPHRSQDDLPSFLPSICLKH